MKKVFITGITGFVGSYLLDYLLTVNDIEVHGLLRWRSPRDNIKHCLDNINLHYGDLLDFSSLLKIIKKTKPDIVFHLAAQSFVPYSYNVPAETLAVNGIGTCNLLEVIKILKLSEHYDPIIHICGSSEEYGQVTEEFIPITEDCPLKPVSPYGVSKVCEDLLAFEYFQAYGLKNRVHL